MFLQIDGLTASYEKSLILNNLSVQLQQGEFVCLCGPNGAGKSTLLSVLSNQYDSKLQIEAAVKGAVLNATPISKMNPKELAKTIAYMQQNETCAWDFTVQEVVLQGRYPHTKFGSYSQTDYEITNNAINEMGISHLSQRKVLSLSGGEFQKVRIARALCQQPAFMLLDEPAANLDFVYEPKLLQQLKNLAHNKNIGILISIHDVNTAVSFADKILLLPPQQSAIYGTPDEVINIQNLNKTFGVEFQCKTKNYFQSLL